MRKTDEAWTLAEIKIAIDTLYDPISQVLDLLPDRTRGAIKNKRMNLRKTHARSSTRLEDTRKQAKQEKPTPPKLGADYKPSVQTNNIDESLKMYVERLKQQNGTYNGRRACN